MDMSDPIVQEGYELTLYAIDTMAQIAQENGVGFTILLIPTKELVYAELFQAPEDHVHAVLIQQETDLRETIIAVLEANDIAYVDSLPMLQEGLLLGQAIYPNSFDGHPLPAGYRIIADALAEHFINLEAG